MQSPSVCNPVTVPAVVVHVSTAEVLAGVDNLLIDLADQLISDLPSSLTSEQLAQLQHSIRKRTAEARESVGEWIPPPEG